ncbi:DgyrCDS9668 [Dimorphilus gyrociliatus]|uniref:DgyrCDS9668 n=1 Tax=Dimorphilus gyrociliatus TaxID=2664684 RepID=A0A7I8VZB0_9ANNE|nr:DgyrCDS9668 [Dimorphilus gyrociliatus]
MVRGSNLAFDSQLMGFYLRVSSNQKGEIMLIAHTKTSGHPIEYARQKYFKCQNGDTASRAQVSGMYIWIISDKVQSQTCRSSQYQYSIEGDEEIIIGISPYNFNDKTSSAFMSPLIPEEHLNLGIHSYKMIDSICKLGGLTEPERYSTCDNLNSDGYEQKFLYQIFEPANSTVQVEIRGMNFSCSLSNTEPYVMVYVKAYTQYFNQNDLWSGEFLICTLNDHNGKCSYICNCVFCLFFAIVYSEFKCPIDSESKPIDGTFGDPNYCEVYYQCINGIAHLQVCPIGFHYKFIFQDCRYVICIDSRISDCQSSSSLIDDDLNVDLKSLNDADECSPNKNETVANSVDCRSYYNCVNGVAWPQRCPTGYYFTPIIKNCNVKLCVPFEEANCAIPGGWSEWSEWSDCKPACGQQRHRTRVRECNNPPASNGGLECQGNSIDVDQCESNDCNDGDTPAFMVSLLNNEIVGSGRMNWTQVVINQKNLFNEIDNSLNIQKSGMYVMSVTAHMDQSSKVDITLEGTGRKIGLSKLYNVSVETITRCGIFTLTSLHRPNIVQNQPFSNLVGSLNGTETSWSGFYYKTDNYLSAARDSPTTHSGHSSINLPIVTARKGFEINGNNFIAMNEGLYFISYGSATMRKVASIIKLHIASFVHYLRMASNRDVPYAYSVNFIRRVEIHDVFGLQRHQDTQYSDSNLQIHLNAFKLNESFPIFSIISTRERCSGQFFTFGFNALPYVDNMNGWIPNRQSYKIPTSGTYFVTFNLPNKSMSEELEVYIDVNGNQKTRVVKASIHYDFYSGYAFTGVLMKLSQNDELKLMFKGCTAQHTLFSSLTIIFVP